MIEIMLLVGCDYMQPPNYCSFEWWLEQRPLPLPLAYLVAAAAAAAAAADFEVVVDDFLQSLGENCCCCCLMWSHRVRSVGSRTWCVARIMLVSSVARQYMRMCAVSDCMAT